MLKILTNRITTLIAASWYWGQQIAGIWIKNMLNFAHFIDSFLQKKKKAYIKNKWKINK